MEASSENLETSDCSGSTLSFEESVDQYQMRLLTLEVELKEMSFSGRINRVQHRKKQDQLIFLAGKLEDVRAHWATRTDLGDQDPNFPLPASSSCSPAELTICEEALSEKAAALKKIASDSQDVVNWVKGIIAGKGVGLLVNFHLSSMRKKMHVIDGSLNDIEKSKKKQIAFTQELEKEELSKMTVSRSPIETLKEVFSKVDIRNKSFTGLQSKTRKEEEKVSWMRRWLKFQELKMESYFPVMGFPDPVKTRELSKKVLGAHFFDEPGFEYSIATEGNTSDREYYGQDNRFQSSVSRIKKTRKNRNRKR